MHPGIRGTDRARIPADRDAPGLSQREDAGPDHRRLRHMPHIQRLPADVPPPPVDTPFFST